MQSSRPLAGFDFLKRGRFMMKISLPEEDWAFCWTLSGISRFSESGSCPFLASQVIPT